VVTDRQCPSQSCASLSSEPRIASVPERGVVMRDSPHDKLFKEAFGNRHNAAAELRCVLPSALLAHMDLSSLTPLPGSFRDVALADSSSDLLFSVRIAGREALVYVLFEHKSATDRWVSFQLLRYMVRIWERCRQDDPKLEHLPPIVPLVVHHNDSGWKSGACFHDLIAGLNDAPELAALTPRFEFLLDDIGRASDEQLRARALNAFGILALLFLRDVRTPERFLAAFGDWADLFHELQRAPDGARALMVLFRYVSMVADKLDWPRFRQVVHTVLPEAEDSLMTIAEELRQQGLQQGLQQGQRALLVELLRTKFGSVDKQVLEQLEAADEPTLKRYAQRVLTSTTLEQVFSSGT
jgi:predicted transposase YdaD